MTLEQLSAAATQGEWNHLGYCGQDGNIQGPRQEQIASLSSAWGKSDQTGHQCFANAKFIVALVNLYRTGQLVEVQADDATVERVARALKECPLWHDMDGDATIADFHVNDDMLIRLATAAIAAMKGPKL